ncbi:MAG TPA: hypothetical protein VF885_00920 [Arthrobacter sp.]
MSLHLLAARLEEQLRPGAADPDVLARLMASAIRHYPAEHQTLARRRTLMAMSSVMARHLLRAQPLAFLTGHFIRAGELGRLGRFLKKWTIELHFAAEDPAADLIRISLLELRLASSTLPEARDLRAAVTAMSRVGLAGAPAAP